MTSVSPHDLADPAAREAGLAAAVTAVRGGKLVVLPTDTVYGIGCDAFSPSAVSALLAAKGRSREMPPPVMISTTTTLAALGADLPWWVTDLTEQFWPGALTVVVRQQPSLRWDLGESQGTVAIRMPDDEAALELLGRTGPMAVTSANTTGVPPATTVESAQEMLGESVSIYLDGGPSSGEIPSTILDCTSRVPHVLREGAIAVEDLRSWLEAKGVETGELTPDA